MARHARGSISSGLGAERWFRLPARWRRSEPPASAGSPQSANESSAPAALTIATNPVRRTLLVTVLGLSGRALEEILELVVKRAETTQIAPVFITDTVDFGPFRRRRLRFEYLPDRDRQQRFAPELDWDLYLRRRYALLGDKWHTNSVITFGRAPPRTCVVEGRLARKHRTAVAPNSER